MEGRDAVSVPEADGDLAEERCSRRGDLKYVILDLLAEKPSHGYEVMQTLEEKSRGFYSPSPGSVYPTLQLLEDLGYVSVEQRDGKKVYSVTDEGRKFLEENRQSVEDIWGRVGGGWDPAMAEEMHGIRHEVMGIGKRFGREMHGGRLDSDKLGRVREVISSAVRQIEDILDERGDASGDTSGDTGEDAGGRDKRLARASRSSFKALLRSLTRSLNRRRCSNSTNGAMRLEISSSRGAERSKVSAIWTIKETQALAGSLRVAVAQTVQHPLQDIHAARLLAELSVPYLAGVGLQHNPGCPPALPIQPFSSLSSGSGSATLFVWLHHQQLACLSVPYLAGVGLQLDHPVAFGIGPFVLSVPYLAGVGLQLKSESYGGRAKSFFQFPI